jgi:hypothetical protein
MESKAGSLTLYDFTGEGAAKSRIIVGLLTSADGTSWFLKMTGDADPVGAARADFIRLLESLHFD